MVRPNRYLAAPLSLGAARHQRIRLRKADDFLPHPFARRRDCLQKLLHAQVQGNRLSH